MWSALTAEQDREIADEGITDCPTVDQVLVAERLYDTPMFETDQEFGEALRRGDVV